MVQVAALPVTEKGGGFVPNSRLIAMFAPIQKLLVSGSLFRFCTIAI